MTLKEEILDYIRRKHKHYTRVGFDKCSSCNKEEEIYTKDKLCWFCYYAKLPLKIKVKLANTPKKRKLMQEREAEKRRKEAMYGKEEKEY